MLRQRGDLTPSRAGTKPQSASRGVIFSRGLFGLYGYGWLLIDQDGLVLRWSGILTRARERRIPWPNVEKVAVSGSRVTLSIQGQLVPTTVFIFQQLGMHQGLMAFADPSRVVWSGRRRA